MITLFVIIITSCSMDNLLTEDKFAEKWIKSLQSKNSEVVIKETNGLKIITEFNNEEYTHFLNNAYADYKNDPVDLDSVIDTYTESLLDLFKPQEKINQNRIVPLIKDNRYLIELKKISNVDTIVNITENYNNELVIVYAEDKEKTISQFTKKDFKELNLSFDELKKIAINNLYNILPQIEKNGENGFYMITAGGSYESSLILLDDIWTKENFKVDGDFVIGIPARDILLITGSNDKDNLLKMINLVKEIDNTGSHIVSNKLFIRKNQKFELFK